MEKTANNANTNNSLRIEKDAPYPTIASGCRNDDNGSLFLPEHNNLQTSILPEKRINAIVYCSIRTSIMRIRVGNSTGMMR
jgi:hypothetical protein